MKDLYSDNFLGFLISLSISFVVNLLIIKKNKDREISNKNIQDIHVVFTSRLGGMGIYLGIACAMIYSQQDNIKISLLLGGFCAFAVGVLEDVYGNLSVKIRLMGTLLIGIIFISTTGISLSKIGITAIDALLSYKIISILLTTIAIGGVANAINIIDGMNGSAALMLIISYLTISFISISVNDIQLSVLCLIIAFSYFGFLILNWPFGYIFLGDGGAYLGGATLAWLGLLLVERNTTVSPFAPFLICIYPITEVAYSIIRRKMGQKNSTKADNEHLHTLIYKKYLYFKLRKREYENSACGIIFGVINILPATLAYIFKDEGKACILISIVYISIYSYIYNKAKK